MLTGGCQQLSKNEHSQKLYGFWIAVHRYRRLYDAGLASNCSEFAVCSLAVTYLPRLTLLLRR